MLFGGLELHNELLEGVNLIIVNYQGRNEQRLNDASCGLNSIN